MKLFTAINAKSTNALLAIMAKREAQAKDTAISVAIDVDRQGGSPKVAAAAARHHKRAQDTLDYWRNKTGRK